MRDVWSGLGFSYHFDSQLLTCKAWDLSLESAIEILTRYSCAGESFIWGYGDYESLRAIITSCEVWQKPFAVPRQSIEWINSDGKHSRLSRSRACSCF